jgi:hypothetical protein
MTNSIKLTIPCCIKTSEIADRETLEKVVKLFEENGVEVCEYSWHTRKGNRYYGIDWDKEAWFWNNKDTYSENDNEYDVLEYTLKDLFPETEDVIVAPSEVLVEDSTKATIGLKDEVQTPTEPFKVVKHSYYDVTIKGEEYRFTKEEANLLCTLLIEAIGEDYEPS